MGNEWPMHLPEHLKFYSPAEIEKLLHEAGLARVTVNTRYEKDRQIDERWKVVSGLNTRLVDLVPWPIKLPLAGLAISLLNRGSKTTATAIK